MFSCCGSDQVAASVASNKPAEKTAAVDAHAAALQVEVLEGKCSMKSQYNTVYGDFILDGALSDAEASYALENYGAKGWLFLNPEDAGLKSKVEGAGIKWKCIPVSPSSLDQALADNLVAALSELPRPTMIQCSTARRASAAYALYMGHSQKADAKVLANTLNLSVAGSAPMMDWLGKAVSGASTSLEPIFRQLFDAEHGSSTYTYLIADPITKDAVLIDPVMEQVDRDLGIVKDLGLNLVYAINTHCHADHITGTGLIKQRLPNVKSGIAKAAGAKADIFYEHGDVIKVGGIELEARATPGHTNGCMSYYTKAGGGMVFTGDAVLIRGCGRTDFQQGSSEQLYKSVHEHIFTLPEETKLFPAHDYKGRTMSTVGEEKTLNPRLTKSVEEFQSIMANLNLPYPKKIDASLPANLVCGIQD